MFTEYNIFTSDSNNFSTARSKKRFANFFGGKLPGRRVRQDSRKKRSFHFCCANFHFVNDLSQQSIFRFLQISRLQPKKVSAFINDALNLHKNSRHCAKQRKLLKFKHRMWTKLINWITSLQTNSQAFHIASYCYKLTSAKWI